MASGQNEGIDVGRLRAAVRSGNVEWQRHALERALEREITRAEVLEVLENGERIENYPHAHPLPRALLLGWSINRPLHVVAAFDSERNTAAIITVYEPSLVYFEPDFKTRRKQI